ncbi:MAG: archaeal proteasome endopeptidase complex subunit beta [Sulfolobales archaeon]
MLSSFHGTTTVGIVVNDGVVLAADKRVSSGYYVAHKVAKKIIRMDDRAALTISGLVADAQILGDYLRVEILSRKVTLGYSPTLKSLASLISLILNSSKYYPYIVQLLLGGYDTEPRLYSIELFGGVVEEDYSATGSGSPVAIGIIEGNYRRDMSLDEAINLAVKAVSASMARDVFTGEAVDVVAITKDSYREYSFKLR